MPKSDFIKEIILKFKAEGGDQVKRTAESMSKAFSGREVDRFIKSMESLNQKMGKSGGGLSTEMKKITEYFKELNTQHFAKAERNLDRLGRLITNQIQNLDKLKREGASADLISQREATLRRTAQSFERHADALPAIPARGVGGALRQMGGGSLLRGVGGAISGATQIADQIARTMYDIKVSENRNMVAVANDLKQRTLRIAQGDISAAVLRSNPAGQARMAKEQEELVKARSGAVWTGALSKVGAGIGAGAIAGGLAGAGILSAPFAAIGAIGAGTAGLISGGADLYKYYLAGGKEQFTAEARSMAEQKEEARSFQLQAFKDLMQKAPMRYQYQRQLAMGDYSALDYRTKMRGAGVLDEQQMASTALSLRRFGAVAPETAVQSAVSARGYGLSNEFAVSTMSRLGMANQGGITNAQKDLESIMQRAIKNGIMDSGIIEEYSNTATAIIEQSAGRISADEAAANISRFMAGSGIRDVAGAGANIQRFAQTMTGTSQLAQTVSVAGILDLARDSKTGKLNYDKYKYLQDAAASGRIGNLSSRELSDLGISEETYKKYQSSMVDITYKARPGTSKDRDALIDKLRSGDALNPSESRMLLRSLSGQSTEGMTSEAVAGGLKGYLDTKGIKAGKITKDSGEIIDFSSLPSGSLEAYKSTQERTSIGTSAGKVIAAQADAQSKLDFEYQMKVSDSIEEVMKTFSEQIKESMANIDSGILSGPIEGIATAGDAIAGTLMEVNNKIREGAGLPPASQAGSEQ